MIRKEFVQAIREPRLRFMLIFPPIIQLLLFGYASNLDLDRVQIAWKDADHTPQSRALRAAFESSGYFQIVKTVESDNEVRFSMDRGEVLAAVSLLPGFADSISRHRPVAVQVLVEGTNSNIASLVSSYSTQIVTRFGAPSVIQLTETRVWFNAELKSRHYFIPGVLMNIITVITLMLTSMAIVREKEIGTMEQLMVTPLRPVELIAAKTLPFVIIGLFDLFLVTVVARLVFEVPFRGTFAMLLGSSLLFLLTTLGSGLFISTVSRTQQQALMSSFLFFLPAFLLSGFAFPVRNMPEVVQWISAINPQRYFIEILRGVFLKGSGTGILWPQLLALLVLGLTIASASVWRFRRTLD